MTSRFPCDYDDERERGYCEQQRQSVTRSVQRRKPTLEERVEKVTCGATKTMTILTEVIAKQKKTNAELREQIEALQARVEALERGDAPARRLRAVGE